jgi:hypothetical protein
MQTREDRLAIESTVDSRSDWYRLWAGGTHECGGCRKETNRVLGFRSDRGYIFLYCSRECAERCVKMRMEGAAKHLAFLRTIAPHWFE